MMKHWKELSTLEKQIHLGFIKKPTLSKTLIVLGGPEPRRPLLSQEEMLSDRLEEREYENRGILI